ncbi:hypothetical protein HYV86_04790 [Candidatus Woesearchaeota archaeon]|nr:hypothetical protein [Candidatus Woesearchaeota archaeon]
MKPIVLKGIGIFFMILVLAAMVLFALGRIPVLTFWIVLILCGLVAFVGLPWLKKRLVQE